MKLFVDRFFYKNDYKMFIKMVICLMLNVYNIKENENKNYNLVIKKQL